MQLCTRIRPQLLFYLTRWRRLSCAGRRRPLYQRRRVLLLNHKALLRTFSMLSSPHGHTLKMMVHFSCNALPVSLQQRQMSYDCKNRLINCCSSDKHGRQVFALFERHFTQKHSVRAVAADLGTLFIHYTQYKLYTFNLHSLTFSTPSPLQKNTDETIRHVAINAAERGVLLLRVRDEIRMVLKAYQTLYESSIAFGMRKSLMAEQKRGELAAKVRP